MRGIRTSRQMREILTPALLLLVRHAEAGEETPEERDARVMLEKILGNREILGGIAELLAKEGD